MPTRRLHLVSADEDHRVSTIELFFDLVFVYAITQVTQLMADHLSPTGVGQGPAMLAVLWWCWCSYAWPGTTIHVDHGIARPAMFGAMAVMFLVSLTIPEAFVDFPGGLYAPALFVVCYALVRLLHLVAYLGAAKHDPGLRHVLTRMFVAGHRGGGVRAGAGRRNVVDLFRRRRAGVRAPAVAGDRVERAKLATDSYTFLHLPMIAGIVLVALGLKKSLLYIADTEHHTPGEALHGVPIWTFTGGLALYLVALSALRKRNLGSWNHQRLVVGMLLVAATPLLEHVPAAVLLLVVAGLVLGLVTFERLRFAEWRKRVHADHS